MRSPGHRSSGELMTQRGEETRGARGNGRDSLEVLVHRLESLITAGDELQAQDELRSTDTRAAVDAELHSALGFLAERLGDVSRAVLEYNYSLRDAPGQATVLLRLARLRADQGRLDRALRAYRKLAEMTPADQEVVTETGELLETMGRPEEASHLYAAFLERVDNPAIRASLDRLQSATIPQGREVEHAGKAPGELVPSDADLVTFASSFAGREGVHARQWASSSGKHGYSPINEPFTPAVARGHLLGSYTVGIYPLRMDNTVHFMAFDLDVAKHAMGSARDQGPEPLLRQTQVAARALVDAAAVHGMSGLIEESGRKGRHVWLLFESPIPASAARRLAGVIQQTARPAPPEVTVEVFPRQSRVAAGGLGNLIKLPLGIHRVTGRRSLFLDADGRPVANQFDHLRSLPRVPRDGVQQVLGRERAALCAGVEIADAEVTAPGETPENEAEDAEAHALPTAVLCEPDYRPGDDPELLWLLDRCPLLAEVVRRAQGAHVLSNDERIVLTYTVGHLSRGADAVNAVLAGTLSADPRAFLKSRLRGNPMSCPKMRSRIPNLAAGVACDCRFDADAGLYPTPLLHLQDLRARGVLDRDPADFTTLQVERHVMDLYRARTEAKRAARLARDIEQRLAAFMEEQDVTELNTSAGRLRLLPDGQGLSLHLGSRSPVVLDPVGVGRPVARVDTNPQASQLADHGPAELPRGRDDDPVRDRTGSDGGAPPRPAGGSQGPDAP